jgi:4-amino-4-deoxy-L-arabinose transferase-like glycosyltransferase
MSRRNATIILIVIIGVALWIRIWGIGWGLPHAYHPDEGSILIHSLGFGTGDMNPHWFRWPSLMMYFVFGLYAVFYLIGKAAGTFGGPLDLARAYLTDLTPFWLIGRYVSVAAGVATVWTTYLFGRTAFGRAAGLIAAALVAVGFLHVRDSHYATPDVATTFLASVSLLFALYAVRSGRASQLVLSGLLAGLAASTKYPGVIVFAGTLTAFVFLVSRRAIAAWVLPAAIVACVVGFVIGTPYSVVSAGEFSRDVLMQFTMVSESGVAQEASSIWRGLGEVFGKSLGRGVGYPVLLLAVLGFVLALSRGVAEGRGARRGRAGDKLEPGHPELRLAGALISLVYVVCVLLFLIAITVKRSTYVTPAIPAIAAMAGAGIVLLLGLGTFDRTPGGRGTSRAPSAVAAATTVAIVVLAFAAWPSLRFVRALDATDTRTQAKQWVEENIEAGSTVVVESYGPELNRATAQLEHAIEADKTGVSSWSASKRRINELELDIGRARHPQYRIFGSGWGQELFRIPEAGDDQAAMIAAIEEIRPDYLVITSKADQRRPMEGAEPPGTPSPSTLLDWIGENGVRVARFAETFPMPSIDRGPGRSFHNPVVEIYELTLGDAAEVMDAGTTDATEHAEEESGG